MQACGRASLIVLGALGEYNLRVEPGLQVSALPDARLYSAGAGLDSLGLLDLIIILKTRLAQELGRPVAILEESQASDGAMFRTVESLTAAVRNLLETRFS